MMLCVQPNSSTGLWEHDRLRSAGNRRVAVANEQIETLQALKGEGAIMQLKRLAETRRSPIDFSLDGRPLRALDGDTVLTAILINGGWLRQSEFGDGPRAGFCMMGACHDCMVWTANGGKLRACTTPLVEGMVVFTQAPETVWPARISL